MTLEYDNIRVLWIEDQPGLGVQSEDLEEFSEFFKIVKIANIAAIGSVEVYDALLKQHLADIKDNDMQQTTLFPVEIVSADYDLSKYNSGSGSTGDRNQENITDYAAMKPSNPMRAKRDQSTLSNEGDLRKPNYDDFDGCIINNMYLSAYSSHPCGSVVTTYQDPKPRHRVAKMLEHHLERLYQIDLTFFETRTWEAILTAGVIALRKRILKLYADGTIVLSLNDLMAMADGKCDGVLAIKSPHAVRQLPIRGLFIDQTDNKLEEEVIKWASGLLRLKVNIRDFMLSTQLANTIWEAYNNDILIEKQSKLSNFLIDKSDNDECNELIKHFGLKDGAGEGKFTCTENYFDIQWTPISYPGKKADKNKSNDIRRMAVFILVRKLLKRILIFSNKVKVERTNRDGNIDTKAIYPSFEENDILLLLYPVPKNTLPLPWHISDSKQRASDIEKWTRRMSENYKCHPKDILNGTALTQGERQIFQGLVIDDDEELGDNANSRLSKWKSYEPARLFLFGELEVNDEF